MTLQSHSKKYRDNLAHELCSYGVGAAAKPLDDLVELLADPPTEEVILEVSESHPRRVLSELFQQRGIRYVESYPSTGKSYRLITWPSLKDRLQDLGILVQQHLTEQGRLNDLDCEGLIVIDILALLFMCSKRLTGIGPTGPDITSDDFPKFINNALRNGVFMKRYNQSELTQIKLKTGAPIYVSIYRLFAIIPQEYYNVTTDEMRRLSCMESIGRLVSLQAFGLKADARLSTQVCLSMGFTSLLKDRWQDGDLSEMVSIKNLAPMVGKLAMKMFGEESSNKSVPCKFQSREKVLSKLFFWRTVECTDNFMNCWIDGQLIKPNPLRAQILKIIYIAGEKGIRWRNITEKLSPDSIGSHRSLNDAFRRDGSTQLLNLFVSRVEQSKPIYRMKSKITFVEDPAE